MKRETIVLGAVAAVCTALLVAALVMRTGGHTGRPTQAAITPEPADGAQPGREQQPGQCGDQARSDKQPHLHPPDVHPRIASDFAIVDVGPVVGD